ncbi:hypothetical protein UFOVP184_49 [uncultured Caudovirales phage]|uniref:Uncharacterized protein n=1 Tax=uncultured Caudovirales phage TaxID=2100421 RepID=A0A6J7WDA8_9CAUD|nr:hypothetical protein UFOVP184_49 [uncultured Caudovirales phage]
MSDSAVDPKLLRESILRKERIRALLAENEALKATIAERDAQLEEITSERDTIVEEMTQYFEELEANEQPLTPEQEELNQYRQQARMDKFQKAIDANDKIVKGIRAEHIAAITGLNIDALDGVEDFDGLMGEVFDRLQQEAPVFFASSGPVAQPAAGNSNGLQSGTPAAGIAKRLPTFASQASGGGIPTPAETSLSAVRLRDPAAAQERAALARANNNE